MEEELNYNNLDDVLKNISGNYKILEERINVEVQKDFYESSKNIKLNEQEDQTGQLIQLLKSEKSNIEDKKLVLQKLAMIDKVEAYRAIENYTEHADPELKDWSVLSLQQSRMVMHSSLMDEQQVFISTGLGGKDNKLRYFFIFPFNTTEIKAYQHSTFEKELPYFVEKNEGEIEEIEFHTRFATALTLLPLEAKVSNMVKDFLAECNQFGEFLSMDVIVTNIKKFEYEEIINILKKHGVKNQSGSAGTSSI